MFQDRRAFPTGINTYVAAMQYVAALVHGQPTEFNLGTPAVSTANAVTASVAANAVANTIVAQSYTSDARYGRNLILTVSADPGNTNVIDVYGFDYLGQPMIERFSGASGATAVLYGKKCFYRVTQTKIITASTNVVTYAIGTGSRLGLPFKGDVAYAKEAGIQIVVNKRDIVLKEDRPAALAAAGGSVFVRAPCPGFVKSLQGWSYGAGSTNDPVITVKLATVAIIGLTVTIDANVSTTASIVTDDPTTVGYNANNRCIAGDLIEIAGAAAASAAGDTVQVTFTPTHCSLPDLTDPQTAITGDPRGSYEPVGVLNGVNEIRVAMVGDNQVNASSNGGLHGLRHFFA